MGGAATTTLSAGITSGDTSFTITTNTGWPTGANGDFFVVLDRGNAAEEKIRCASRSGSTVTVQTSGRGSDGTAAAAHSSGVIAEHCLSAIDADEANYTVAKTVGLIAAQGDILVGSAANTLVKLAKGTSGLPLVAGASTVSYAQLNATNLVDGSIAAVKVTDLTLTNAKFAEGTIAASKLASEAWTAWTPTVTAFTGTLTTATGAGRSMKIGRTVIYQAALTITTNGTGSVAILYTFPYTASGSASGTVGSGSDSNGKSLTNLLADTTHGLVRLYDGTYPGSSGIVLYVSGAFEAAT